MRAFSLVFLNFWAPLYVFKSELMCIIFMFGTTVFYTTVQNFGVGKILFKGFWKVRITKVV